MENYLYFRKLRPATATAARDGSNNYTVAFSGVGVAANLDNINEIASIAVTSAAGGGMCGGECAVSAHFHRRSSERIDLVLLACRRV